jgi:hypothetical protein
MDWYLGQAVRARETAEKLRGWGKDEVVELWGQASPDATAHPTPTPEDSLRKQAPFLFGEFLVGKDSRVAQGGQFT